VAVLDLGGPDCVRREILQWGAQSDVCSRFGGGKSEKNRPTGPYYMRGGGSGWFRGNFTEGLTRSGA